MKKINFNESVWQIATTKLTTVLPNTSLEEIINLFNSNNFHHLPVVDSGGLLKGIISSTDLAKIEKLLALYPLKGQTYTAEIIMTPFPYFLNPRDSIEEAIELFLENRFHALPIVENGVLMGIITTHDILELTIKLPEMVMED